MCHQIRVITDLSDPSRLQVDYSINPDGQLCIIFDLRGVCRLDVKVPAAVAPHNSVLLQGSRTQSLSVLQMAHGRAC